LRRILFILILLCMIFAIPTPVDAQGRQIRVFYAGPEGGLKAAIGLNPDFEFTAELEQADVIVLNGQIPDPARTAERVRQGAGLLLVMGPTLSKLDVQSLLAEPVSLTPTETDISLIEESGEDDPIISAVIWTSSPQIKERTVVESAALIPLVRGYEDPSPILAKASVGKGNVFVFAPYLGAETNAQFQQWAYFNYWVYHLITRLAGQTPLPFSQYPGSPVPHENNRLALLGGLGLILVTVLLIFWRVRRYSLAHPEALESLVVKPEEYETRQASTAWDEIGFHRPLGGFLLAFMMGVIIFIPLIIYQNMILPAFILPSAQALGIWGRVTQFFSFLWQLFDMGTAAAFVKFFSEYRVHDPKRGIQYGQLYIWWQLISGAVQVGIVSTIAVVILPDSPFALYAWSIILHSIIQIPGFFAVMRLALVSNQRMDYAQIVTLATEVLLPILVQPIFVTLMVVWGKSNAIFGPSMGGLLGLGIAAYFTQLLAFLLGFWLFRRLGYASRILFLAHFDWGIVRSAFRFGAFEMLGSAAWAVGQAMEIVITQARLVNYAEIWGNWGLAQNFIFSFQVISSLTDNLMPSISEAISNGKRMLSQYYSAMAYKWGGIISAYIGAVLLAVADRFILGASGPQFSRAAVYAIPMIIWGAIQYPSWVGDTVQLGSNKPYLKMALVFGEQTIRIGLAFMLISTLQVYGLIVAYFVGLLTKNIASYFINHRYCFKQSFYFWQSLAAPLLAGAVHYLFLRWLCGLIWQGDQITSVLIFFIGILPSFPLFAFLYGLFGGWDDETLAELRQSVELANFMRPLAWLFWRCTQWGAALSPLHGRFPITLRSQAILEARDLTEDRVSLT
jgi:O-antigen/teichoic acid export membrane protein